MRYLGTLRADLCRRTGKIRNERLSIRNLIANGAPDWLVEEHRAQLAQLEDLARNTRAEIDRLLTQG